MRLLQVDRCSTVPLHDSTLKMHVQCSQGVFFGALVMLYVCALLLLVDHLQYMYICTSILYASTVHVGFFTYTSWLLFITG